MPPIRMPPCRGSATTVRRVSATVLNRMSKTTLRLPKDDGRNLRRQGEDDVEVGHRQDVVRPRLAPSVGGHPLAGRAVPVAARVVERVLAPAADTGVHVAAEQGGAARLDVGHDLEPGGVDAPFPALTESRAGAAEDLRHAGALGRHGASAAQDREAREGVVERLEHLAGGAGVAAGRVGAAMPERVPDHFDVAAALKQMGRGRMTQAVEAVAGGDANPLARLLEGPVQGLSRHGLIGEAP